ncbi:hypothetical protein ET009_10395 [Lactococcus garvieae]|nr:hypothetical protein [Lactococcus garvieae]
MIDLEYKNFVSDMSTMFKPQKDIARVIIGESPYPDGKNLTNVTGYPYSEVAFLRSTAAVKGTKKTVVRIRSLLFGDKAQKVIELLSGINDDMATETREEYLARYLAEEQKLYLINAFKDRDCKIITEDLKKLNNDVECKEILILGNKAFNGIKYLSKNAIKVIIHPSARGRSCESAAEQWDSFSHNGTGIYNSSDEIINVFQIKRK